mmetsp:Transcript_36494/g.57264  ORF Transcript_36494/g.57264 Transcript_36494/m.57264 type:complete len:1043 (-) Transcript_36494:104-3232(-)|eukprot:CAMPEP_0201523042 /NCGR_PEP_ID=MMETSP0161_2-20130828/18709_1 /ASSEMBLY_ACC=CAM_ASM_000251 /TAXON_ID=180227 /ORGANISM="Neoparamoeba aestuarina, Strain SoJaBio B1-5/56/2" /LENGTH=1042 /DNA_ID=CAMNT_0047922035 /DNA_START=123 /DNA_END=3251 /DNA_ORIENTATION=-
MDHGKVADQVLQSKKDSVICSNETKKKQVVALGKCGRIYVITPKSGVANVDFSAHMFHLTKVKSSSPDKIHLAFTTGAVDLQFDCNNFLNQLRKLYHDTFPGLDMFPCQVDPESRMRELDEPPERPCGGFSDCYISICNAQGVAPRDDIIWDIENIYDKNKKKKLELEEVDLLKPSEFASVVTALAPNKYFTGLSCSHMTFDKGMAQAVGQLLSKSSTIEELNISNTGLTKGLIAPIADGLKSKTCVIHSLDVSHNMMGDKDFPMLGAALGEMPKGLITLNASDCGTRKGGAAGFLNGLRKNMFMSGSMNKLDLSNNVLDNDGTVALSGFLAQPTGLQTLNLQNCGLKLDQLFAAVVRGCQSLEWLDVSGNKLAKKDIGMIGQFLKATSHLKVLRLSNCSIDGDCLRMIISDINSNMYLNDLDLCISENRIGSSGGRLLGPMLQNAIGIKKLDMAELDLGTDGMRSLLDFLSRNKKLIHLDISGNFTGKSGCEEAVKMVRTLLESNCPLESLSIRGGKAGAIRENIIPLFVHLAKDEKLTRLDVSDNKFGQRGAIALGKAIQSNKKLASLKWDGNDTPYGGFARFTHSLSYNKTLKHMPIPVLDVGSALRSKSSEMEPIVNSLSALITRNSNPQLMNKVEASSGGASSRGGENSFLFKGEATQLKNLKNKVKAMGRTLEGVEQVVMEDCETNDMGISEIYQQIEQAVDGMKSDLNEKLKGLAFEIIPVINNHMNDMQGRIMGILEKRYHSMSRDTQNRLRLNMQFGAKDVDPEEVGKIFMESTATQIIRKAEESYSSAITISSDYIYEKLMEGLQNIVDEVVVQAEVQQTHSVPDPEPPRHSGGFTPAGPGAPPRSPSVESIGSRGPPGGGSPSPAGPGAPPRPGGGGPRPPPKPGRGAGSPARGGPPPAGGGPGAPPRPGGGGRARAMGANLFGPGGAPMPGGARGIPMPGMGGPRGRGRGGGPGAPPRAAQPAEVTNQSVPAPKPRAPVKAPTPVEKPSGASGNLAKIESKESNVDNSVQRNRARGPAGKRPPTRRARAS